ncbi:uncharacterized protein LOC109849595 isoform X1 [Asparagus officinalis]|uniref:uncharacterized protein LOC109849595 isoform X1 n=1 Tax=Asparagus officinalis TaxID=4686 RepID=UPI00098E4286|nr:uncharacterized protein LOC109849595 isoform X1 [Asparagus officinalis]XP_020275036.1 uncharacterized protein LOC109849595 isoform X1 [Asparagus officinalis]
MKLEMADCAVIPSCARVSIRRNRSMTNLYVPRSTNVISSRRTCLFFKNAYFSSRVPSLRKSQRLKPLSKSSLRCYCLGALMDPESIAPSGLASYYDEALLVVSVIFAYMAGAIPQNRIIPGTGSNNIDQNTPSSSSNPYESFTNDDMGSKSNDSWSEVKGKLLDALNANEHGYGFSSKTVESEIHSKTCPLSLFALAEGPRLRLLSASLQQLQKEVSDISLARETDNRDVWLVVASEVIKGSIRPACSKWLEEELTLEIGDSDMMLINQISEKLKGDDTVLQNIDRSGKEELYADLLFFLRFGCIRTTCCYDSKFLTQHGIDILEDLVIMLADGIASTYLELISVDSNMSTEINAMGLTLCSLSTRELQRLRNEVALNRWLLQNFESVVSMYEDRFTLSVFCSQKHEDPLDSQSEKYTWWKKFTFRKAATLPSLNYILISPVSLPVKRTKELRALIGWRYYFSLFLEFSDIMMPLVKTIFTKVRNAVSFLLMCMIGRSLGLIFTGIRQSLGWR